MLGTRLWVRSEMDASLVLMMQARDSQKEQWSSDPRSVFTSGGWNTVDNVRY